MPASLALLLCTIFVLALLRMECRQNPTASFVLWLPTLWILLTASRPMSAWFGVYGEDIESGSSLDRLVLIALFFAALVVLLARRIEWGRAVRENGWLAILLGYALVSICWSDIPYISFKRWIREMLVVPMAFVVLTERWPRLALQSIFRRTIYILIPFSIVVAKYFPALGVEYSFSGERAWVGVALSKNGLGRLCLFAAFFLIWTLIRRWKELGIPIVKYQTHAELLLLFLTFWLMKGGPDEAYSATAVGSLVLGLAVLLGLSRLKKRGVYLSATITSGFIIALIIIGTLTPFLHGSTVGSLTPVLGRDKTFTGRTDVWEKLVPAAMQRPLLGYGVGGFWTTRTVAETFMLNEAHNGYLDVILNYGFTGLGLISLFLLSVCRKAHRELIFDYDWGVLWICFLLMLVLSNITESSIHLLSNYFTAIIVFIAICSVRTVCGSTEKKYLIGSTGSWAPRRQSAW